MMNITDESVIYCDANFLVAIFAKDNTDITLQSKAQTLFATLVVNKCKITASPLVFDEFWHSLKKVAGIKEDRRTWIQKLFDKIYLTKNKSRVVYYSFVDVFPSIDSATKKLLDHPKFSIIQFNDTTTGILKALSLIKTLRPRDAFHLAIAKQNNVSHFITNDSSFSKVITNENIEVVSFKN